MTNYVEKSILQLIMDILCVLEVNNVLVTRLKSTFKTNEPIFTNEILRLFSEYSRAYVFRLIDDAEEKGELVSFDTGVYYLPVKSIMGVSTITADDVVNKRYIKNSN